MEGSVYTLRETRSHHTRGEFCPEYDNVLRDGTLIDLCGATLLWRSENSIKNMPQMAELGITNCIAEKSGVRFFKNISRHPKAFEKYLYILNIIPYSWLDK